MKQTSLSALVTRDVDINFGLDFEMAKERLQLEAGRRFRTYWAMKQSGNASEGDLFGAYNEYVAASNEVRALRRTDEARIRAILRGA